MTRLHHYGRHSPPPRCAAAARQPHTTRPALPPEREDLLVGNTGTKATRMNIAGPGRPPRRNAEAVHDHFDDMTLRTLEILAQDPVGFRNRAEDMIK